MSPGTLAALAWLAVHLHCGTAPNLAHAKPQTIHTERGWVTVTDSTITTCTVEAR